MNFTSDISGWQKIEVVNIVLSLPWNGAADNVAFGTVTCSRCNVLSLCTKNITRNPVWEQRWQIARAHLTTGAAPGIQPLCQAEKHGLINTDIMKEDKCFYSRLQVDRKSMPVLLLIWITGTLQGCIVLLVVKLREQLFSHPWLLPNRV